MRFCIRQRHDGGKAVLKHVGYWLSVKLGKFGVPARFGEGEFAVVIEDLTSRVELETAQAVLSRSHEGRRTR